MTDKKEKILNAALALFAREGYRASSTAKIAREAGVSEGLIFRHFTNKEGLLQAIVAEAEERIKLLMTDIVFETDPEKLLNKLFAFYKMLAENEEEAAFWKLQYKIKWEVEEYNDKKMEPLELALTNSFRKLGYEKPEMESKLFQIIMDGLATRFYLQKDFDFEAIIGYLKNKYKK